MNLDTYFNTQETAASFSKRIRVPMSSLSNWRHNKRPIPLDWMPIIEKETGGLVTRKELLPDDWEKQWPELAQQKKDKAA